MSRNFLIKSVGQAREDRFLLMIGHVEQIGKVLGCKGLKEIIYYPADFYCIIYINGDEFRSSDGHFTEEDSKQVIQLLDSESSDYKASYGTFDSQGKPLVFEDGRRIFSIRKRITGGGQC